MQKKLIKLLISFALCLGIITPTAQPVSRTTQVIAGASGLFAVHAAYEIKAAYKRACKARKKMIRAAKKNQQQKHDAPQEKELKPMTWKEFRSTPKHLTKYLNTKNLLASVILLGAGGYFTTKNSASASADIPGQQVPSSTPKHRTSTTPHTDTSSPTEPLNVDDETGSDPEVSAQPSTSSPTPVQVKRAKPTKPAEKLTFIQLIEYKKKAPKIDAAIQYVDDFFKKVESSSCTPEERERHIVDLQSTLTTEVLRKNVTHADLTTLQAVFTKAPDVAGTPYCRILEDLLYLTNPKNKELFESFLSLERTMYDFGLFKRIQIHGVTSGVKPVVLYQQGKQRSVRVFNFSKKIEQHSTLFGVVKWTEERNQSGGASDHSLLSFDDERRPFNIVSYHWADHIRDLQKPNNRETIRAAMTEDPEQIGFYEGLKGMLPSQEAFAKLSAERQKQNRTNILTAINQTPFTYPQGVIQRINTEFPYIQLPTQSRLGYGETKITSYQPADHAKSAHQLRVIEAIYARFTEAGLDVPCYTDDASFEDKKIALHAALCNQIIEHGMTHEQLKELAQQCGETQTGTHHVLYELISWTQPSENAKFAWSNPVLEHIKELKTHIEHIRKNPYDNNIVQGKLIRYTVCGGPLYAGRSSYCIETDRAFWINSTEIPKQDSSGRQIEQSLSDIIKLINHNSYDLKLKITYALLLEEQEQFEILKNIIQAGGHEIDIAARMTKEILEKKISDLVIKKAAQLMPVAHSTYSCGPETRAQKDYFAGIERAVRNDASEARSYNYSGYLDNATYQKFAKLLWITTPIDIAPLPDTDDDSQSVASSSTPPTSHRGTQTHPLYGDLEACYIKYGKVTAYSQNWLMYVQTSSHFYVVETNGTIKHTMNRDDNKTLSQVIGNLERLVVTS